MSLGFTTPSNESPKPRDFRFSLHLQEVGMVWENWVETRSPPPLLPLQSQLAWSEPGWARRREPLTFPLKDCRDRSQITSEGPSGFKCDPNVCTTLSKWVALCFCIPWGNPGRKLNLLLAAGTPSALVAISTNEGLVRGTEKLS